MSDSNGSAVAVPATNGNGKPHFRKGKKNPNAGTRSKLTHHFIHRVKTLAARGLNQRQIATILGVGESTMSIWKRGRSEGEQKFLKALQLGEALGIEKRLKRITDHGAKTWQADAWVLERRYPEQFAKQDSVKLSNPDGSAMQGGTTVIAPTVVFVQPKKETPTPVIEIGNGGPE